MNIVNALVFSISTSFFEIEKTITSIKNKKNILCITPHVPLEWERSKISSKTSSKIIYRSFFEFIKEDEMKYCDQKADENIIQKYKKRDSRLNEYFDEIKKLKNQIIINNIKKIYIFDEKWILAEDLGIDLNIWNNNGFKLLSFKKKKKLNPIYKLSIKLGNFIKLFSNKPIYYLCFDKKKFYFFGKKERVTQYINNKRVEFLNISITEYIFFKLLLILGKFNFFPNFILLSLSFLLKKKNNIDKSYIFSTLHAYSDEYGHISQAIGSEMICLQDGLLPSNYTSAYYKYLKKVDCFYVWNNISTKIFSKNHLKYNIWSGFKKKKLPLIDYPLKTNIKNVLFLTSGSGDWTAAKNRSDEDLAYLALKNIARKFPEIKFVYRPHPLWINPLHQGSNSIERLIIDCQKNKLLNFEVSYNSLKEASNFQRENKKNVSFISQSIENEIESADIVMGDHSEALLNAAQQKKIIGSVSLAERKELFYDYTSLGFPLMKTIDEIEQFINQIKNDLKFYKNYNKAIERFNLIE